MGLLKKNKKQTAQMPQVILIWLNGASLIKASASPCVFADIVGVLHVAACRWDGNLGGPAGVSG